MTDSLCIIVWVNPMGREQLVDTAPNLAGRRLTGWCHICFKVKSERTLLLEDSLD